MNKFLILTIMLICAAYTSQIQASDRLNSMPIHHQEPSNICKDCVELIADLCTPCEEGCSQFQERQSQAHYFCLLLGICCTVAVCAICFSVTDRCYRITCPPGLLEACIKKIDAYQTQAPTILQMSRE